MFRAPFGARYNFFFGRLVFALLRRMSDLRTIKVRDASMRRKIIESRSPEKTWLQKTDKVLSKPLKEDAPLSQPLRRKSAPFYAVKRPQSENKSINTNIHLRSAICSLFRGQTSAIRKQSINNNIHLRSAIYSLFRGQTFASRGLLASDNKFAVKCSH